MAGRKNIVNPNRRESQTRRKIKIGVHLNADTLIAIIGKDLQRAPDHRAATLRSHWTMR